MSDGNIEWKSRKRTIKVMDVRKEKMKRRSYQNWLILTLSLMMVAQWWIYNSHSSVRAQEAVAKPRTGEMQSSQAMRGMASHETASPQTASPFARAMAESMDVMHREMMTAPMNGVADHDFLSMMIPHHQGAIEMAKLMLLHGRDERVRRLAEGIIVEQQSEIAAMRRLLDKSTIQKTGKGK